MVSGAPDQCIAIVGVVVVARDGIELEPICGRSSPQAKS
jgi:hypothetical protein